MTKSPVNATTLALEERSPDIHDRKVRAIPQDVREIEVIKKMDQAGDTFNLSIGTFGTIDNQISKAENMIAEFELQVN